MGLERALKMPHVVALELYSAISSMLRINRDFRDKIGHVITQSDDPRVTASAAEEAVGQVVLRIQ
jgi:biotin carboxylase